MKKTLYIACIALLGITASCARKADISVEKAGETVDVTIVPSSSKTAISGTHSSWTEDDAIAVGYAPKAYSQWLDKGQIFPITLSGAKATFSGRVAAPEYSGTYRFFAIHPFSDAIVWNDVTSVITSIPAEQTAANGGFDSDADILISSAAMVMNSPATSISICFISSR